MLHHVFDQSLAKSPHAPAVMHENGVVFSYQEIDALARHYAQKLAQHPSLITRPYVGVLSSVQASSIACLLAILRMGLAYVPLDDTSPPDRLALIQARTQMPVIFCEERLSAQHLSLLQSTSALSLGTYQTPPTPELQDHPTPFHPEVLSNLAYILHSSGSTGVPKGIMLTHHNARTFVDWMHKEFQPTSLDIFMARAPLKFDLSVWDIFNAFKAGACVACFDNTPQRSHKAYVDFMRAVKATFLYTTPSTLRALLHHGALENLSLKTVMYAGEPFTPAHLKTVMEALPGVPFANIYGPTETNIITYHWIQKPPQTLDPIPLGRVVDDTEILVVDPDTHTVCSIGELGELWCRGGTVTLGYLGDLEKTAQALAQSPILPYPALMWRTGDFGFLDKDGLLHYRGRRDHCVKVLGHRIELGEIESVLSQLSDLEVAVITAHPHEKLGHWLKAHYKRKPSSSLTEQDLQAHLRAKLPPSMQPHEWVEIADIPYTSSGKIDRIRLAS